MKSGEEVNNIVESVYSNSMSQVNSLDISGSLDPDINANTFEENSDVNFNCSSRMNGILEEFTKLYTDKLMRIDDVSGEKKLKSKLSILECWVKDLGEQNSILVSTVEELEREASRRVSLLQEKLDKMAVVTRDSCLSLRDHQVQVTSLIKQKLAAEDEVKNLQDKVLSLEESKGSLLQENSFLRQDFDNVLEVLSRGRLTGRWDCSDFTFNLIRPPENLLRSDSVKYLSGNVSPKNFDGSESPKSQRGSLSSLLSTEEELSVPKLKQEIHNLRKLQRETNLVLTQRDKHIADLQAQLTDLHHKFSAAQTQVENTTSTLYSLMDRGRHDSFEIFRRDDVIRQLLSPSRRLNNNDAFSSNFKEEESKGKVDAEYQLSNNIDILANRLADLEEECSQLRRQNVALKRINEKEEFLVEQKNVSKNYEQKSVIYHNFQIEGIDKHTQTVQSEVSNTSEETIHRTSSSDSLKISKLENELSEKNILIRELQNHLVLSREEIRLKDETLRNIEQKLECCRRNYDEKEERMLYLTSQLTNLQLEVSRLHGTLQQLRLQLDNKSELVLKLEYENRSLVRQLNEKSSVYEGIQKDFSHLISDIESKKKEIAEQKLTIGTLQDALVASKMNCDKLKNQYMSEGRLDENNDQKTNPYEKRCRGCRKGRLCSCRRAKSCNFRSETSKVMELNLVIDELSSYLHEAHQMALAVEKERRWFERHLHPEEVYFYQESQRQQEALHRIRNENLFMISKLQNVKNDLLSYNNYDDHVTHFDDVRIFEPSNRKEKCAHQNCNSPLTVAPVSEVDCLRSRLISIERELEREKAEKENLSKDANVVVSSVRKWLHFQKIANSHLQEKFEEQQHEIENLSKENNLLLMKLDGNTEVNKEANTETCFESHCQKGSFPKYIDGKNSEKQNFSDEAKQSETSPANIFCQTNSFQKKISVPKNE